MPNWKKVIVSGSSPELSDVQISTFGSSPGGSGTVSNLSSSLASRIASAEGGSVNTVLSQGHVTASRAGGVVTIDVSSSFSEAISGSFQGLLSGSLVKDVGAGVSGSVTSTGSFGRLELAGNAIISGNIVFGDADTDFVAFGSDISSSLIPDANNKFDLGSTSKQWNVLHVNSISASGAISSSATATASFGHLLVDGSNVNALSATQIAEIGAGIISASAEGDAQGQIKLNGVNINTNDLGTGDSPTFSGLTVSNNLNVNGNLDVNGTLTTIDSANLRVADRFILAASGSTSGDGGLVVNTNAAGNGTALFYDDSAQRWGLTGPNETGGDATTAAPKQYITTVSQSSGTPPDNPSDFGTDTTTRRGMMYVDTATGEIYIWS